MSVQGWKYYNHAMVPDGRPDQEPELTPVENGEIWSNVHGGGTPLLARWTTDWDCGYETNWWYCIKDTPVILENLGKQARKDIRKGLKNCTVRIIECLRFSEQLYECYEQAWLHYKNVGEPTSKEAFIRNCERTSLLTYWAAFENETGKLIGYMSVSEHETYAEICTAKFYPVYLHLQVSAAMYYTVLNHYLEKENIRFVSSGSRSINHTTQTQDYKERTFGYRKAYCKLHIEYNPKIKWIINIAYPFKNLLKHFDGIRSAHLLNSVLKMEEIVRSQK